MGHPSGVHDRTAARCVEPSTDSAVEQSEGGVATGSLHTWLPELLLFEVLRLHLATAPAGERTDLGVRSPTHWRAARAVGAP